MEATISRIITVDDLVRISSRWGPTFYFTLLRVYDVVKGIVGGGENATSAVSRRQRG